MWVDRCSHDKRRNGLQALGKDVSLRRGEQRKTEGCKCKMVNVGRRRDRQRSQEMVSGVLGSLMWPIE